MPWEQTTWHLVGGAALLFTMLSIVGLRDAASSLVIGDVVAVLLWVLWAINAFAVNQVTNTGTTITHNYPSLGYIGMVFAIIMVLDLFLAVFELLASEERGVATDGV